MSASGDFSTSSATTGAMASSLESTQLLVTATAGNGVTRYMENPYYIYSDSSAASSEWTPASSGRTTVVDGDWHKMQLQQENCRLVLELDRMLNQERKLKDRLLHQTKALEKSQKENGELVEDMRVLIQACETLEKKQKSLNQETRQLYENNAGLETILNQLQAKFQQQKQDYAAMQLRNLALAQDNHRLLEERSKLAQKLRFSELQRDEFATQIQSIEWQRLMKKPVQYPLPDHITQSQASPTCEDTVLTSSTLASSEQPHNDLPTQEQLKEDLDRSHIEVLCLEKLLKHERTQHRGRSNLPRPPQSKNHTQSLPTKTKKSLVEQPKLTRSRSVSSMRNCQTNPANTLASSRSLTKLTAPIPSSQAKLQTKNDLALTLRGGACAARYSLPPMLGQ